MNNASSTSPPAVQRQIMLPMSKAVEIAWKNIRMRLSRSLLVTSGIVLALAFLMSILANDAMVGSMRQWMDGFASSPQYSALEKQREQLQQQSAPLFEQLRAAAANPKTPAAGGAPAVNAKETFGAELPQIQKDLGTALPASPAKLLKAVSAQPELIETMKQWIALQREKSQTIEQLNGAEVLRDLMSRSGVATKPQEIENDKITTRWLLGLALLVAFVGILNAMLMSVTERFREIGTMKCLGALDSFIVKLFLIESLFQGIVGTIIGIAIGLALSLVGQSITYGAFAWKNMPWNALGVGIGICFLVGVGLTVAGAVYPAWQAARMQPIEAMRVET